MLLRLFLLLLVLGSSSAKDQELLGDKVRWRTLGAFSGVHWCSSYPRWSCHPTTASFILLSWSPSPWWTSTSPSSSPTSLSSTSSSLAPSSRSSLFSIGRFVAQVEMESHPGSWSGRGNQDLPWRGPRGGPPGWQSDRRDVDPWSLYLLSQKDQTRVKWLLIYEIWNQFYRKVLDNSESMTLRQEGDRVKVSFYFEAELEMICNPHYSDFPFNYHYCKIEVGSNFFHIGVSGRQLDQDWPAVDFPWI